MLTRLQIINIMLASTGVSALTDQDTQHPDYLVADAKLDEVINATLKLGFWFNTYFTTLTPEPSGEVLIPANTLSIDPVDRSVPLVQRGKTSLFNTSTRDRTYDQPVVVKVIEELAFDDLPPSALDYIRAKAKYSFYLDDEGMDPKLSNYRAEVNDAWSIMYRDNIRNLDVNYFDNPSHGGNQLRKGVYPSRTGNTTYVRTNNPGQ